MASQATSKTSTENNPGGKVALEEGISLSHLSQGGDITFSVKNPMNLDDPKLFETAEDTFDPESLVQHANMETVNLDGEHYDTPFENIRAKMAKVTPTGTVMKRVFREGIGEIIPERALVCIHYNGYFEFNETPFDSTYLRGKSLKFNLGSGFLPGIDIAVSTMRNREKSEFWLHPSVAFGKIGCPPRIPPNAEVLFQIEVMYWEAGHDAAVARASANEGRVPWETTKEAFKACLKQGIEFYGSKRFKDSKTKLEKAKHLLDTCCLKDEAEEEEQKKYMFKVSLNLAMVFNKLQGHGSYAPSAIINCKEALQYDPNCKKAHLQWGIALTTLGEYEKAKHHLDKVRTSFQANSDFQEANERLMRKMNDSYEAERAMWSKAFDSSAKQKEEEQNISPEVQEIINQLQGFSMKSDKNSMVLPSGVTPMEKEQIKSAAETMKLNVEFKPKSIVISKK